MVLRACAAVLAVLVLAGIAPAAAQGTIPLFGYGAQSPQPGFHHPPRHHRFPYLSPYFGRSGTFGQDSDFEDNASADRGGPVRTLCVRLCDGYYFPISHGVTRSALGHDADQCAASCGSEVRLFYHASQGEDVDSMIDLGGMAYASLPNAYRYRRAIVPGCTCKPQPWAESELQRHRGYQLRQSPRPETSRLSE